MREQLKLATKAMGYEIPRSDVEFQGGGISVCKPGSPMHINSIHREGERYWYPGDSQADSDRMACALRIDTSFFKDPSLIVCSARSADDENHFEKAVPHNNTDEDVCRAVREARLAVAVEIGRAMP